MSEMQFGKLIGPPKNKSCTLVGPETSANMKLMKTLEHMQNALNDISERVNKFYCSSVKADMEVREDEKTVTVNGSFTVNELIVLDGTLEKKRVRVLKDDGCNTNVVSRSFSTRIEVVTSGSTAIWQ